MRVEAALASHAKEMQSVKGAKKRGRRNRHKAASSALESVAVAADEVGAVHEPARPTIAVTNLRRSDTDKQRKAEAVDLDSDNDCDDGIVGPWFERTVEVEAPASVSCNGPSRTVTVSVRRRRLRTSKSRVYEGADFLCDAMYASPDQEEHCSESEAGATDATQLQHDPLLVFTDVAEAAHYCYDAGDAAEAAASGAGKSPRQSQETDNGGWTADDGGGRAFCSQDSEVDDMDRLIALFGRTVVMGEPTVKEKPVVPAAAVPEATQAAMAVPLPPVIAAQPSAGPVARRLAPRKRSLHANRLAMISKVPGTPLNNTAGSNASLTPLPQASSASSLMLDDSAQCTAQHGNQHIGL